MSGPDLGSFWQNYKEAVGKALPQGIEALGSVLGAVATGLGLEQRIEGAHLHWYDPDAELVLMFCPVADPRDLDRVIEVYERIRKHRPRLAAIMVHQWTDGEGNWDVFVVNAGRAVQHADRISGSNRVLERDPQLRQDIYSLFSCGQGFPDPGCAGWARLLAGPIEKVHEALAALATRFECTQTVEAPTARWQDPAGEVQALFFSLSDPMDLLAVLRFYREIRKSDCPTSFLFVPGNRPGLFDIFRFSARSFLEHHNQAKAWLSKPARGPGVEPRLTDRQG